MTSDDPFPVKMCVCYDTTFADLKQSGVRSFEDVANRFGCGTGCGLCRPYIARMLETGQTEFAIIDQDND
jgi:bacterioferritin-associated ferredoxin